MPSISTPKNIGVVNVVSTSDRSGTYRVFTNKLPCSVTLYMVYYNSALVGSAGYAATGVGIKQTTINAGATSATITWGENSAGGNRTFMLFVKADTPGAVPQLVENDTKDIYIYIYKKQCVKEGCLDAFHISNEIHRDGDRCGKKQRSNLYLRNKQHTRKNFSQKPRWGLGCEYNCWRNSVTERSRCYIHKCSQRKYNSRSAPKQVAEQRFYIQDVWLATEKGGSESLNIYSESVRERKEAA